MKTAKPRINDRLLSRTTFEHWREPRVKLPVLKLNDESQTLTPSVSSRSLFASNIDFLCMKVKPFCLHKTEGANNHI
jgi:hypothetical protein